MRIPKQELYNIDRRYKHWHIFFWWVRAHAYLLSPSSIYLYSYAIEKILKVNKFVINTSIYFLSRILKTKYALFQKNVMTCVALFLNCTCYAWSKLNNEIFILILTAPHCLQWCRLFVMELKLSLQLLQACFSLSLFDFEDFLQHSGWNEKWNLERSLPISKMQFKSYHII